MQHYQEDPGGILVITFTKAAAQEMKQRFRRQAEQRCIAGGTAVQFGTFHAVFFTILKHAYHYTADNIIRDEVRYQILRDLVAETDLEIHDETEFMGDLAGEISRVKGDRLDLTHYYSPLCPVEIFRKIYLRYQQALERRHLIDFDDMLVYCYELLMQRPDIRRQWQQKFPYLLIDEFQDINQIQYDVIKLLAEPGRNLFIVGDDDQSIYGFRGARPDIMKQFLKDYPEAGTCVLNDNYRCCGAVVEAAGRLIAHNQNRLPKEIQAAREQGMPIEVVCYQKSTEQNEKIREQILSYRSQGIPYHEMAVLFRTNTQARGLASKLMEYNVPFILREHLPNLYEHWAVKDILTYLEVAAGSRERAKVVRIINRPKRYVHHNAFTDPCADFEELKKFYEEKEWMVERICQLQSDLAMVQSLKPFAAVSFIRKGIGYDEYIREYAEYRGMRPDDLLAILDELQEEARSQETTEGWMAYIREYGEELREQRRKNKQGRQAEQEEDAVVLLTMHGAKGLEYDCVFIPDINEGVIPHNKAVLQQDIEEERRMLYVAMTRARDHLHLSYTREHLHKEMDASRFIEEILVKKISGEIPG